MEAGGSGGVAPAAGGDRDPTSAHRHSLRIGPARRSALSCHHESSSYGAAGRGRTDRPAPAWSGKESTRSQIPGQPCRVRLPAQAVNFNRFQESRLHPDCSSPWHFPSRGSGFIRRQRMPGAQRAGRAPGDEGDPSPHHGALRPSLVHLGTSDLHRVNACSAYAAQMQQMNISHG